MSHTYLLVTARHEVGLTSVSLGVVRAFDQAGQAVVFVKPIAQLRPGYAGPERSTALIELATRQRPPEPIPMDRAAELLARGEEQILLEEVVARVKQARAAGAPAATPAVLIVEGLVPTDTAPFATRLNVQIARALDAEVVLVGTPEDGEPQQTAEHFRIAAHDYAGTEIAGCLLNKVRETESGPVERVSGFLSQAGLSFHAPGFERCVETYREALQAVGLRLLGAIPFRPELGALRVGDVARLLNAEVVRRGDMERRVLEVIVGAKAVPAVIESLTRG
ncbi:MAG TPA: AAA family ATPase, partial [Polyangiaceae bacterium]